MNKLKAIEILDSRGNPTIKTILQTSCGVFESSVPSGASTGKHEAKELRDKDLKRYNGKGVLKAVENIEKIIAPKILKQDFKDQEKIDKFLINLDKSKDKSKLGANAILAVSMVICRAGAALKKVPLYLHINKISQMDLKMPEPFFNVVNGGKHAAGNNLDIQEFMIKPEKQSFAENLRKGAETYHLLKKEIIKALGKSSVNIGDEGGYVPAFTNSKQVLDILSLFKEVKISLDCAASEFYKNKKYFLEGKKINTQELLGYYLELVNEFNVFSIEDPFDQEDWEGFSKMQEELKDKVLIIGDDLLCTNLKRIKKAQDKKACQGLLLKLNQIGTVTEAIKAAQLAKSYNWKIMVSHRSGETCDDFIADLAVGIGSDYIKSGAPARGERVAKYNRLLEIEQEL
ncbi:MAG: phosphopyruvate hydratase [Candidatus Pacebacteria bacterium]|nr:phosphopyruvate hydratase [Candidatus Paceibacterota bacterium]